MFCPNGSFDNNRINWNSTCFLETVVICILTLYMTIFGVKHIKEYRANSRAILARLLPQSKLFYLQITITLLIPLIAVTWCLAEVLVFQSGDIFGYQVFYLCATVFVFLMAAKLFLMERYDYLPNPDYHGHSLTIKFFCILVFVGNNLLLIAVLGENWPQVQNVKNQLELGVFLANYVLSLFLLVLCFKSPGLIDSENYYRYILYFNETFMASERCYQMKTFIKALIWPKDNFALQRNVIGCLLLVVASRVANVYVPIYSATIVESLKIMPFEHQWNQIFFLVVVVLSQGFSMSFLEGCRSGLWIQVQQYTEKEFQVMLFHRLQKYSLDWHSYLPASVVIKNINQGTHAITVLMSIFLFNVGPYTIDIFIAILLFFTYFNWLVTIVVFSLIALYLVLEINMIKWTNILQHKTNAARRTLEDRATESIEKFETVKYCFAETHEVKVFSTLVEIYQKEKLKMKAFLTVFNTVKNIFVCCGLLATIGVFAVIDSKEITISNCVLFAVYMTQILRSLNCFGTFYRKLTKNWNQIDFVLNILRLKTDFIEGCDTINSGCSTIVFQDVNYSYGYGKFALKDISFSVGSGKLLAVVGPEGSGKTTIAKLLFKIHKAKHGTINVDGKNILNIDHESLKKCFGAVPQKVDLFDDTVAYNLVYGTEKYVGMDPTDSIITAELRKKLMDLPSKCNTLVSDSRLKLSDEEKRQLAISRMLLKEPPVMIFDEGAGNPISDEVKKRNEIMLNEWFADCTVIYMTRTLSTIVQNASKIIVLDHGEIVESGSHRELMTAEGTYAKMWYDHCASESLKHKINTLTSSPITQAKNVTSMIHKMIPDYSKTSDTFNNLM